MVPGMGGVMEITKDGIVLKELNPGYTIEQIQAATEAKLILIPGLSDNSVVPDRIDE